eukprot:scaffold3267_cov142-Amphora_coffeaeformis.AAC.7
MANNFAACRANASSDNKFARHFPGQIPIVSRAKTRLVTTIPIDLLFLIPVLVVDCDRTEGSPLRQKWQRVTTAALFGGVLLRHARWPTTFVSGAARHDPFYYQ